MTELTKTKKQSTSLEAINYLYRLIIDKCYRMNLLGEILEPKNLYKQTDTVEQIISDAENSLTNALLPRINKILDKGLFDMYQVLYEIDVDETYIKEKIMDIENTGMIPSIIAFAIIDRLKKRYQAYPLLQSG